MIFLTVYSLLLLAGAYYLFLVPGELCLASMFLIPFLSAAVATSGHSGAVARGRKITGERWPTRALSVLCWIMVSVALLNAIALATLPRAKPAWFTSSLSILIAILGVLLLDRLRGNRLHLGAMVVIAFGAHILFNRLAGLLTVSYMPGLTADVDAALQFALVVVTVGFLSTCVSYAFFTRRRSPPSRFLGWIWNPRGRAVRQRAGRWALACSLLVLGTLLSFGFVPLLHRDPLVARTQLIVELPLLAYELVTKLVPLASVCAPILILGGLRKRWLVYVLTVTAAVAIGDRFDLLFMVALPVLAILISKRKSALPVLWAAPLALAFLFVGDAFLKFGNLLQTQSALSVAASPFGEVGCFAYVLTKLPGSALNGMTYLASLVPLPTAWFHFKAQYGLEAITQRVLGLGSTFGGLRITGYGEAYLNFGLIGTLLFGVFLGWVIAAVERLVRVCAYRGALSTYAAICFGLVPVLYVYLAGSMGLWGFVIERLLALYVVLRALPSPGSIQGLSDPLPSPADLSPRAEAAQ